MKQIEIGDIFITKASIPAFYSIFGTPRIPEDLEDKFIPRGQEVRVTQPNLQGYMVVETTNGDRLGTEKTQFYIEIGAFKKYRRESFIVAQQVQEPVTA